VGVSPRNLAASTFGDELVVHNGGRSRVFSVSVKDRGAILPGGHAGKALWFSNSSGKFVTSTYYYDDYPAWVKRWNAAKPADAFKGKSWELLNDRSTYVHGQMDDRPFEADLKPLGRIFPLPLGTDTKYFYLLLTLTTIGDMLTLDFAKTLVANEKLGQNDTGARTTCRSVFLPPTMSGTCSGRPAWKPKTISYAWTGPWRNSFGSSTRRWAWTTP
jgi:hypothetical protein